MADFVLRNLDDTLVARLRERAARHHRSIDDELLDIVRDALVSPPRRAAWTDFNRLAAEIRALSMHLPQTPSEELLRQARDER